MVKETIKKRRGDKNIADTRTNHQLITSQPDPTAHHACGREVRIQQWLTDIDAPSFSTEELNRLCKGSLADALLFLSEHLRGRREVAQCRVAIQKYVPDKCA